MLHLGAIIRNKIFKDIRERSHLFQNAHISRTVSPRGTQAEDIICGEDDPFRGLETFLRFCSKSGVDQGARDEVRFG